MIFQLVLLGLFCGTYAAAARGSIKGSTGKWILVGIVFLDLFMFAGHINNAPYSAAQSNAPNPVSVALKERADAAGPEGRFRFEWNYAQANLRSAMWELDSYNGYIMSRPPHEDIFRQLKKDHKNLYYDVWNVRYKIFQVQTQQELNTYIQSVPPWAQAFARQGIIIQERTNALPRVWFVPNAVIKPDEEALAFMQLTSFDPRKTVVLAEPVPQVPEGIIITQASTATCARLKSYDHTEMTVEVDAPAPGYVVFSELYYKGWQASVDGKHAPVLRADIALRAVQVPVGTHTITLTYEPGSFKAGLILYIAGFLIVIPAIVIRGKASKRS